MRLFHVGHVSTKLLGTNGFHVKVENETLTAADSRCCQNLNMKISRRRLADYCTTKRAARTAQLSFPSQPIK